MNFEGLPGQFGPATSSDTGKVDNILPLMFLAFRGYRSLGVFLSPDDAKLLGSPPYPHSYARGKLFPKGKVVRFCFCPMVETTIIPMSLGGLVGESSGPEIKQTQYTLQKEWCRQTDQGLEELSGYCANVKLDFFETNDC